MTKRPAVKATRSDPYRNFKFRILWEGRIVAGFNKTGTLKSPVKLGTITLERGLTHDPEFMKWAGRWVSERRAEAERPRKDIELMTHDVRGVVVERHKLLRCRVLEYTALPELDANANAVAIESMKLELEGWSRDDTVPVAEPGPADASTHRLDDLVAAVRREVPVRRDRDRARPGNGDGMIALFAGSPGTGKFQAAEAVARALDLSLLRIDLSHVVSKYIGETEKNLRQVFDAAEEAGAVLFFDEVDALFGQRTEVKDAHDRAANLEVGRLLLDRIERFRGLVVLATPRRDNLDDAFVRRLRWVIEFPTPDLAFDHLR